VADETTVVAESSPAVAVAAPYEGPVEVEDLNDEQRDTWRKTGDLPVKPKAEDSAPSKPVAAKPASEKKAESGTAKKKPDQESNWRQLEADRNSYKTRAEALEKENAELKSKSPAQAVPDEKKAASLAASTAEPQAPERPKRPRLSDFTTNETYEAAMDKHEEAMLEYPAKRKAFDDAKSNFEKQRASLTERQQQVQEKWKAIESKGVEIYGKDEYAKIVKSQDLPIYQHDPVERFLRDCEPETAAHMLQYLGMKRKDLERIITLPAREQFRELEALESAMSEELTGTKPEAKKNEPPKKEVTAAKKPPSEVGGKGVAAEDESEAALKAGDVDRYIALENAKDIAKRKNRR
jgi:hypothetical protein